MLSVIILSVVAPMEELKSCFNAELIFVVLSVVMLSIIILSVVAPMEELKSCFNAGLIFVVLSVVKLSIILLSVVMLSVVALMEL